MSNADTFYQVGSSLRGGVPSFIPGGIVCGRSLGMLDFSQLHRYSMVA
jgi:hypothetical protein